MTPGIFFAMDIVDIMHGVDKFAGDRDKGVNGERVRDQDLE